MLYFKNRKNARSFARKSNRSVVDRGAEARLGRRWAVRVLG